ncbi:MAG: aldehyde dehydrogenase family protein, partial [Gemmatimonadetes bacterium]|nr:aldehyde dehydrogenase family protein [Gemmatimonadota bacterium]
MQVATQAHPNEAKAKRLIARFRAEGIGHLIGGSSVPSAGGDTFKNATPIDHTVLCNVSSGGPEEVDAAARAAKEAFVDWRETAGSERKQLLHRVADLIEANGEEIALLETFDTGQPIRFMSKAAARAAENFRFFADRAESASDGLSLPAAGHLNYTLRQPIGPVGIITPWNTPFMLSTWKMAPALATGCTVVHKPAEWSPVTATRLAELVHEAGIPPGVVNVVNGIGETAGRALTEHPDVKAIGFVGDTRTGRAIMRQGAETLKRVHFELGGKNPVVVFADADLDRALDATAFMIYS